MTDAIASGSWPTAGPDDYRIVTPPGEPAVLVSHTHLNGWLTVTLYREDGGPMSVPAFCAALRTVAADPVAGAYVIIRQEMREDGAIMIMARERRHP